MGIFCQILTRIKEKLLDFNSSRMCQQTQNKNDMITTHPVQCWCDALMFKYFLEKIIAPLLTLAYK